MTSVLLYADWSSVDRGLENLFLDEHSGKVFRIYFSEIDEINSEMTLVIFEYFTEINFWIGDHFNEAQFRIILR